MLPFLMSVFGTDAEGVRRIPKSNLAFRRLVGADAFKATTGMTMTKGQSEAAPFVKEKLAFVQPHVIILEGITLMDPFGRRYCSANADTLIGEREYAMWRGRKVRILEARSMHVVCLKRAVTVIAIGHPSSFGMRPEFQNVVRRTADIVRHGA
jgi:uracil-DNA glycosylase